MFIVILQHAANGHGPGDRVQAPTRTGQGPKCGPFGLERFNLDGLEVCMYKQYGKQPSSESAAKRTASVSYNSKVRENNNK